MELTAFQAWKTAARIHTLPAALVPVLVGSGLASGDFVFRWDAFALALACRIQAETGQASLPQHDSEEGASPP